MLHGNTDGSPFLVLWRFYLAFLGIIVLANIVALIGKLHLERQVRRMYERRTDRNTEYEA